MPVLVAGAVVGCKDATVDPELRGNIQGRVLDFETDEPIAGASITSSPPSEALVTGADGGFLLEDLGVGNYQVSARKSGFQTTTVSVSVRESRTSNAMLFLKAEDPDATPGAQLNVDILSFWTSATSDSTFAEAEYRVRNDGDVDVSSYKVSFRIATAGSDFFHEVTGGALKASQFDIRRLKAFIPENTPTSVEVDAVWFEEGNPASGG